MFTGLSRYTNDVIRQSLASCGKNGFSWSNVNFCSWPANYVINLICHHFFVVGIFQSVNSL